MGWFWVSLTAITGNQPEEVQYIVDYMPPINSPTTENTTIHEVLKTS